MNRFPGIHGMAIGLLLATGCFFGQPEEPEEPTRLTCDFPVPMYEHPYLGFPENVDPAAMEVTTERLDFRYQSAEATVRKTLVTPAAWGEDNSHRIIFADKQSHRLLRLTLDTANPTAAMESDCMAYDGSQFAWDHCDGEGDPGFEPIGLESHSPTAGRFWVWNDTPGGLWKISVEGGAPLVHVTRDSIAQAGDQWQGFAVLADGNVAIHVYNGNDISRRVVTLDGDTGAVLQDPWLVPEGVNRETGRQKLQLMALAGLTDGGLLRVNNLELPEGSLPIHWAEAFSDTGEFQYGFFLARTESVGRIYVPGDIFPGRVALLGRARNYRPGLYAMGSGGRVEVELSDEYGFRGRGYTGAFSLDCQPPSAKFLDGLTEEENQNKDSGYFTIYQARDDEVALNLVFTPVSVYAQKVFPVTEENPAGDAP